MLKWTKKRLNVALAVFDAVKSRFPETNEFIDDTLKEECEKEKITADEAIFLQIKSKKVSWKKKFYFKFAL